MHVRIYVHSNKLTWRNCCTWECNANDMLPEDVVQQTCNCSLSSHCAVPGANIASSSTAAWRTKFQKLLWDKHTCTMSLGRENFAMRQYGENFYCRLLLQMLLCLLHKSLALLLCSICFVFPGKVQPHQKVVNQGANSSKESAHEGSDVLIMNSTERPQIAEEQTLLPHDVILMSPD